MFDTLLPLAPGLDVNDVVKNKAEDTHDNAEDTSMASPDNDRIVPVLKASPALLAKARNEYYDSIEAIPTYEARLEAVMKRLVANKDNLAVVSLFAWGRMTFTIKVGGSRELWKPKRAEALAIFAHIYQNRRSLFNTLAPGYEFVFEDASTARNTIGLSAPADEWDFVALQKELDTHWGVHKRRMCPALRHPSALLRPMSPSMISGSLTQSAPKQPPQQGQRTAVSKDAPLTHSHIAALSPVPTSPPTTSQLSTLPSSYPALQRSHYVHRCSPDTPYDSHDANNNNGQHRSSWPIAYRQHPDSAVHSTRCATPNSSHSASPSSPFIHEHETESAAEALLMMSSSAPSQPYRLASTVPAPIAWGMAYPASQYASNTSPPQRYHPYRSRSAPDAKPIDTIEAAASHSGVGHWRPW